jgi:Heterokaryon incompatibility protein (HET)
MSYWTEYLKARAPAPSPQTVARTVQGNLGNPERLCQECSDLNLEALLSNSTNNLQNVREWEFDNTTALDAFRNSICPLCRVFAVGMEEEDTKYSLCKSTGLETSNTPRVFEHSNGPPFLGIYCSLLGPPTILLGFSVPAFSEPRNPLASVQLISESRIDYEILKSWIVECQNGHGMGKPGKCHRTERIPISALKVIDCSTKQVEMAMAACQYVALSYVWGPAVAQQQPDCSPNTGLSNLPRTVEDAILVTLKLGYRYLWVDRYCIDQDDGDNKAIQVNQMDLIYHEAEVTIVATAGDDPTFGLPGVTTFQPRVGPIQVNIGGLALGAVVCEIFESDMIAESKWNTRGWTYQEAILSKRRLFFTEGGVQFDCPAMKCHETLTFQILNGAYDKYRYPPCGIGRDAWDLTDRIDEYSSRSLTYSSDKLDGFQGVLRAFERSGYPVRHHWGVPILFPKVTITSKLGENKSSCLAFVLNLCWSHVFILNLDSKRLPEFPSWSWCGWAGRIESRGLLVYPEKDRRADENDVKIRVQLADGRLVDWDDFNSYDSYGKKSDSLTASPYLLIEAWTIPVKLHYVGIERHFCPSGFDAKVGDGSEARLFQFMTPMKAIVKPTATELEDIESRTYTGIMLSQRTNSKEKYPFILVAEEKEGFMERVGNLYLGKTVAQPIPGSTGKDSEGWDIDCLSWERREIRLG